MSAPISVDRSRLGLMLNQLTNNELVQFYESLDDRVRQEINNCWELQSLPHQRMPPLPEITGKVMNFGNKKRKGNKKYWRRWLLRGGRGCGKTHGAARSIHEIAKHRKYIRRGQIGIIHSTWANARFGAVEGPSGILATAPSDFRPHWSPGNGVLTWPNGVIGRIFSADEPATLRNNNWSLIWADEVDHWKDVTRTWWEVIEPALRIGIAAAIITTTPQNRAKGDDRDFLKNLEELDDTVVTRATTFDNPHLDRKARQGLARHYGVRMRKDGTLEYLTKRGQQELGGGYIDVIEGALWNRVLLDTLRVRDIPDLSKVAIGIDPAGSTHKKSNKTGIVGCGIDNVGEGYVLADRTGLYKPHEWGEIALNLFDDLDADEIVGEVNFGGDMVESTIRAACRAQDRPMVPFVPVRASRGKFLRAHPVATLYEGLLVHHVGVFEDLEKQQCEWEPGDVSPDNLDALVHGLTHLMLRVGSNAGMDTYA